MADQVFMYIVTIGVFAVLTAILFGSRAKRHSGVDRIEKREGSPV